MKDRPEINRNSWVSREVKILKFYFLDNAKTINATVMTYEDIDRDEKISTHELTVGGVYSG